MDIKIINSSLVVVAEEHNPSVFSHEFLLGTGILDSADEIDRGATVITPDISLYTLKNKTKLEVVRNRFYVSVQSDSKDAVEKGKIYIKENRFLKCSAIGINFRCQILDIDFNEWLKKFNFITSQNFSMTEIKMTKLFSDEAKCNVTILPNKTNSFEVTFNFDYKRAGVPLKDINLDLSSEYDSNRSQLNNILNSLFN